jgi:hypothetical protein
MLIIKVNACMEVWSRIILILVKEIFYIIILQQTLLATIMISSQS